MQNIPNMTIARVSIWDLNKLCNKLLNKIKTPVSLYSFFSKPNFVFKSSFIFFTRSFLLRSFKESLILNEILASSLSTDI